MRTVWEYLSVRFTYKGRGITQEFQLLDVNGERLTVWTSEGGHAAETLPDFLMLAGRDGWELVSHVANQDVQTDNIMWHYMHFKRPQAA